MSTITLPNIRVGSDLQVRVRLTDGGVAIDWSTLSNIKAYVYSDAQRAMAGRCTTSVDGDDPTLLVCNYAATKPQYLGANRIIVSCSYMGETKTYDKPAFTFVRWTDDQEGEEITIEDPDVDVEINVEDVSSSILQEVLEACIKATEEAREVVDTSRGPRGYSAYEIAVQEGFEGTEEEWLASLQGEDGQPGPQGPEGDPGPAGVTSATVSLEDSAGTPSASAYVEDGVLYLEFSGLKGEQGLQGNTGSSVDYPYELVNNCTTDDATKGLSAAQGVVLKGEISQLEAEVHNLSGKYYGLFEDETDLPAGDAVGYAFVGTSSPFSIWNFDGEDWSFSGATVVGITGEPGVGFSSIFTPDPYDGTVIIVLSNNDTITLDLNHNHPAYYSKVAETSIPSGGFLPDVVYSLGTLTGTVAFALAAAVTGNVNHYFWMFDTGSTAPTVTWPSGLTWADGSAPTVAASKHYEVSILGGIAYYSEV